LPKAAVIALEDGVTFPGEALAGSGTVGGELVFTTSMTGYQEVITDPSYHGQLITFTFPLIGNYGVHADRDESDQAHARAVITRETTNYAFSHASTGTWLDWLAERDVLVVTGVDTRALTRHIRDKGALRAVVSTEQAETRTLVKAAKRLPPMAGLDLARAVTRSAPSGPIGPASSRAAAESGAAEVGVESPIGGGATTAGEAPHVVAYDFGIKASILRRLLEQGFRVTLVPAQTSARDVLRLQPDGVFLSNGPGDPAAVTYAVKAVTRLLGKAPIFGICLGHQLLALALGLRTYKLKFGHRGSNHPVKDLTTGIVEITTQNHGFAVSGDGGLPDGVHITHLNLNDHTVEGLSCPSLDAFSVQYHPEASPGPHDARYLFTRFRELVDGTRAARREGR
jgi:carbamoyl-phosphate synthase small subunit